MSEQSRPHAMGRLPGQAAISHTAPHHLHGGSTLKLCRDAARVTSVTICQATGIPTTMQIKICMTSVRRGDSRGNNRIVKNTSKKNAKHRKTMGITEGSLELTNFRPIWRNGQAIGRIGEAKSNAQVPLYIIYVSFFYLFLTLPPSPCVRHYW